MIGSPRSVDVLDIWMKFFRKPDAGIAAPASSFPRKIGSHEWKEDGLHERSNAELQPLLQRSARAVGTVQTAAGLKQNSALPLMYPMEIWNGRSRMRTPPEQTRAAQCLDGAAVWRGDCSSPDE